MNAIESSPGADGISADGFDRFGTARAGNKRLLHSISLGALAIAGLVGSSSVAKADPFSSLLQTFSNYDYDSGCTSGCVKEINSLQPLLTSDPTDVTLDFTAKLIVVLVESRIINQNQGTPAGAQGLLARLRRYKTDLVAEGYVPRFVQADVYGGTRHQDGKTLLALRRLLRAVKSDYPSLQGTILVGNFPEALLVQEVGVFYNNSATGAQTYTIQANRLTARSEIVLSDLDGGWENIYQEASMNLPSLRGLIEPISPLPKLSGFGASIEPLTGRILTFTSYETTHDGAPSQLGDFFYIRDTTYTTLSQTPKLVIKITSDFADSETGPTDGDFVNRIAYPEIFVSRINARHVAMNPDPSFVDVNGRHFLDANGKPQTVQAAQPIETGLMTFPFVPDLDLERRILLDYFDRNHRYRGGGYTATVPYACIQAPDLPLSPLCPQLDPAGLGTGGPWKTDASLLDYVNWLASLATSTTVRGIDTHSSSTWQGFGWNYGDAELAAAVGSNPWQWVEQTPGSLTYVPMLGWTGVASQFLYRTLWENKILANASPSLFLDMGCDANTPENQDTLDYAHPRYGIFQHAENILFFANGVAIGSRAREFNDYPLDFGTTMEPDKANFGMGMLAYHDRNRNWEMGGAYDLAHRKRAYFWSVNGDWTVRKSYANGIGLLGVATATSGELKPDADTVVADKTWFTGGLPYVGLDYDSANANVKAIADFDNDGRDELLLENAWGLGLIDHQGQRTNMTQRFVMLTGAPSGSMLGDWTYNRDTDVIAATGDYDKDGRQELLAVSPTGLGILKYDGNRIGSVVTASHNASIGGWTLNTSENNFYTLKRNNGRKHRILVTGSWGMGVIELSGTSFAGVASAKNGTKWGNWNVATGSDVVQGIGDFDGDGADDILIKSGSQLGILSLASGGSKTSLMVQGSGAWFGGWQYNSSTDVIGRVADMDTDGQHTADIFIRNSESVGILSYSNGNLTSKLVQSQGTMFGSWPSSTADTIEGTGDFTGDGLIDILVSNRQAKRVGVLTLSNGKLESKTLQNLDGSLLGNWVQSPCMNIVGTGVFTEGGKAKYLAQARPATACASEGVLGDAWNQGSVVGTEQRYPRDFNIFVQGTLTDFQHVQGPVGAGAVNASSFSLNWELVRAQPAALLSGNLTLSQGTVSGDIHCTGSSCSYPNVTVKGKVLHDAPMDYASVFSKLQGLSSALSGLPANGKTWKQYNALTLTGTDPDLNVFSVDASAFQNTTSIALKVPATSTTIINVAGTAVAINYASMNINGTDPGRILWNLYQATSYENRGMSFSGSVLAPTATATIQWGNLSGTVVAASAAIQAEMYSFPFKNNWLVP